MILPTMCGYIPTAITPTAAAADHGHQPNTMMALALSDNGHFRPETKGCISDQGLKRGQGHGNGLPRCHVVAPATKAQDALLCSP